MPRMLFQKNGTAVWISHLDLMRLLQRAFRRAGILLKHSQGFTPHPCLSIAMPLSVGVSSDYELADFELEERDATPVKEIAARLNAVLPEGVRILRTYSNGQKLKDLKWLKAQLTLVYDAGVPAGAEAALEELFSRPALPVQKHSKKGPVEVDIQPLHQNTGIRRLDGQHLLLEATVSAQNPTLNPLLLVTAIETWLPQYRADFVKCHRLRMYNEAMEPFT